MARASLVPSLDEDIHFVLCRFGRAGLAYVETDPTEADATAIVRNLLYGQYGVYCGPVLRHPAGPIQAANFRLAITF